jgi:cell division protein ZapA
MADGLVPVQILGQRYPIRSELDPRYVQELANYVDEKMRAVADQAAPGDSLRLAVVAALNLADEAFRARGADDARRQDLEARVAELERLLDQALASPPTLP